MTKVKADAVEGNGLRIEKPNVKNVITCNKCKKDSGYVNSDFIHANIDRDIKCKKCGEVCIKLYCSKKTFISMDNKQHKP